MNYGPELTPKQRKRLQDAIDKFNKEDTLKALEQAGKGGNLRDISNQFESNEVFNNPDLLSEEDALSFSKPALDPQVEVGKLEVKEILSPQQYKVWKLMMQQGLSQDVTAHKLRISESAVDNYLVVARKKVEAHFKIKLKVLKHKEYIQTKAEQCKASGHDLDKFYCYTCNQTLPVNGGKNTNKGRVMPQWPEY